MAKLLDLPDPQLRAFTIWLSDRGVTAEEALECTQDPEGTGVGGRRIHAFKNPPPFIEPLWRPVPENPWAIEVNLAFEPKGPPGAEITWRWGRQEGWVHAEWKNGTLYVDGVRYVRRLEPEQQKPSGFIQGYDLRRRLEPCGNLQIHPNVMDAAIEAGILPVSFGGNGGENDLCISAWGVGFGKAEQPESVASFFTVGKRWEKSYDELTGYWRGNDPSLSASSDRQG